MLYNPFTNIQFKPPLAKRRPVHWTLLLVGLGCQNWYWLPHAIKVPVSAHTGCAQRQMVPVQQGQFLLQMQSFKNVTIFMFLLAKGISSSPQIPAEGSSHDWSSLQREGQNHTRKQKSLGFSHRNAVPDSSVLKRLFKQCRVTRPRAGVFSWCLTAGGARVCVCSCLAPLASHQCHMCSSS